MVRVTTQGGFLSVGPALIFDAPCYDVAEDGTLRVKGKDGVPVATFVRGSFAYVTTVVPDVAAGK